MKSIASLELIKDEITSAFHGVVLGNGISLEQTKVIDRYGEGCSGEEFARLPDKEITGNWELIPKSRLDEAEGISFLDAAGLRYYLPALMIRLLENYDASSMMAIGTISALDARSQFNRDRYSLLSEKQKIVVAQYVEALPMLVDLDSEGRSVLIRAFDAFWTQFVPVRNKRT